jgi:hypothetical protein
MSTFHAGAPFDAITAFQVPFAHYCAHCERIPALRASDPSFLLAAVATCQKNNWFSFTVQK